MWALTQLMRQNMDETVEILEEVCARGAREGRLAYQQVRQYVGVIGSIFPLPAAQEIRLRLGDFYLRQQRGAEAAPWLEDALEAGPDDPLAIFLEANCRFALYGEKQAIRDMESVVGPATSDNDRAYYLGGGNAALLTQLGVACDRNKDLENAAFYLSRAVELSEPADFAATNATARLLLGDVLIRLGQFDKALDALVPISIDAHNFRDACRLRAVALTRMGNTDAALALLLEASEIDPMGAILFLEMGRVHLARDEIDLAEVAFARAFRTDPELAGLGTAIVSLENRLGRHMDRDAGLPAAAEFTIPDEFICRFDDSVLLEKPNMQEALRTYVRVMRALITRDVLGLYSHSGMGYLWALAQPLVFVASFAVVFSLAGRHTPLGTSVMAYLAAGIVPYVSFYARVESAVASTVRSNVNLLYFRQVTPFVLISAAALREYLTSLVVFVLITGGIAIFDKSVEVHDPLTILAALTGIALIGTIVGTLFGLGQLAIPSLVLVETVITRGMFFFSGALYYANLIPARMREYALLNPMLHLIEFVRDGLFVIYHSKYVTWSYPMAFIGVGIACTMVVLYSTRRFVVAQ
jgi:capsular polysaccharide transport system permease protein